MKITAIQVYQVDLPLYEGSYNWSGGKSVQVFDSNIVAVKTDTGMVQNHIDCAMNVRTTLVCSIFKNKLNFKAEKLNTYRFCDNVWTFMLNDVEFREINELGKSYS